MTFKKWLVLEKKDLANGFSAYPKRRFLFAGFFTFLFFWLIFRLWFFVSSTAISRVDTAISIWTRSFRLPFLDNVFGFITIFGSTYFVIFAFLLLTIFLAGRRKKRASFAVFLTLISSLSLIYLLKELFGRVRPNGCNFNDDCLSFPSGHATLSFYFYGMLLYLAEKFAKFKKNGFFVLWALAISAISLISFSRIYLGFHFFSDILAGFLLGGAFLMLGAILIDFLYDKKN